MRTTEPCGCRHDGQAWLSKCELHSAEDRRSDARWAAEHVRRSPGTRFTPEYMALAREHDPGLRNPMDQGETSLPRHNGHLVENIVAAVGAETFTQAVVSGEMDGLLDWLDQ